jgi:hypothetical protein
LGEKGERRKHKHDHAFNEKWEEKKIEVFGISPAKLNLHQKRLKNTVIRGRVRPGVSEKIRFGCVCCLGWCHV